MKGREELARANGRDRLKLRLAKFEDEDANLRNQNSSPESKLAGVSRWVHKRSLRFFSGASKILGHARALRIPRFSFRIFRPPPRIYFSAWYGHQQLPPEDFSPLFSLPGRCHAVPARNIISPYGNEADLRMPQSLHQILGSAEIVRACLEAVEPAAAPLNGMDANFSFVTIYCGHHKHFEQCAQSVQRAVKRALAISEVQIEWVVANDESEMNGDDLWRFIPLALHRYVRLLSDGMSKGIVSRHNEAIAKAKFNWILFLDCDDEVSENTIEVLSHYQNKFPECRYISSTMEDVDENGNTLCLRCHEKPATQLFEAGMIAGQLKAIRRDLIEELRGFDSSFEGVQDYDFALRTAVRELILQIPEPLCRHHCNLRPRSVTKRTYQARKERAVASSFLRGFLAASALTPLNRTPWPRAVRGLCILRTQGLRLELLASAIKSVSAQRVPMTPCVVVHADPLVYDQVRDWLGQFRDVIALHAPKTEVRRGEPCNIALSFLEKNMDRFDFFGFLDDDDHLLPNFSERLTAAARHSGADVIIGLTNAIDLNGAKHRQHSILPISSLCVGNCIPINSYIVRSSTLATTQARFDTSMDYMEDWDFLLRLLSGGASFAAVYETVAEYRLLGDGNVEKRRDPQHFQECYARMLERGDALAKRLSPAAFWRDVLDFPDEQVPWLTEANIAHLRHAMNIFTRAGL